MRHAWLLALSLAGCANQCGGDPAKSKTVEVADAASIEEGNLGHASTAVPATRPITAPLRAVHLGAQPAASADQ